MTGRLTLLLAVALALTSAAAAELSADQRMQLLTEAQAAYSRGVTELRTDPESAGAAFALAAQRYRQLVDDGVRNGRLLYNLGNAYLQKGDVGRAILAYRGAEALIPGDPQLDHNLEYARSLRRDRIAASGSRQLADALLAWKDVSTTRTRVAVFAVAWSVFWAALLASLLLPRPAWRWAAGGLALFWIASGTSIVFDLLDEDRGGVILAEEVVVRKGNGDSFAPQFEQPLHEGVEFTLREARGDWLFIELPNGASGWIRRDQAGLL